MASTTATIHQFNEYKSKQDGNSLRLEQDGVSAAGVTLIESLFGADMIEIDLLSAIQRNKDKIRELHDEEVLQG